MEEDASDLLARSREVPRCRNHLILDESAWQSSFWKSSFVARLRIALGGSLKEKKSQRFHDDSFLGWELPALNFLSNEPSEVVCEGNAEDIDRRLGDDVVLFVGPRRTSMRPSLGFNHGMSPCVLDSRGRFFATRSVSGPRLDVLQPATGELADGSYRCAGEKGIVLGIM
jgi:hypothetical protein